MSPFRRRRGEERPARAADLEAEFGRAAAWGETPNGGAVIATKDGLIIEGDPPTVLPWHCIDQAVWEEPAFAIRHRDPVSGSSARLRLELARPGKLPPVVRDRVTRSVLVSRRVPLVGELGAVLAARRDSKGAVNWTVVFDPGLDPADPELQQRARDALEDLRRSLGA